MELKSCLEGVIMQLALETIAVPEKQLSDKIEHVCTAFKDVAPVGNYHGKRVEMCTIHVCIVEEGNTKQQQ